MWPIETSSLKISLSTMDRLSWLISGSAVVLRQILVWKSSAGHQVTWLLKLSWKRNILERQPTSGQLESWFMQCFVDNSHSKDLQIKIYTEKLLAVCTTHRTTCLKTQRVSCQKCWSSIRNVDRQLHNYSKILSYLNVMSLNFWARMSLRLKITTALKLRRRRWMPHSTLKASNSTSNTLKSSSTATQPQVRRAKLKYIKCERE